MCTVARAGTAHGPAGASPSPSAAPRDRLSTSMRSAVPQRDISLTLVVVYAVPRSIVDFAWIFSIMGQDSLPSFYDRLSVGSGC